MSRGTSIDALNFPTPFPLDGISKSPAFRTPAFPRKQACMEVQPGKAGEEFLSFGAKDSDMSNLDLQTVRRLPVNIGGAHPA
jgi:hypothetical protein